MFDWVADNLAVATPQNVVRTVNSADCRGYIRRFNDYLPLRYESELQRFQRLSGMEQMRQAQIWFDNIEPGFLAFG